MTDEAGRGASGSSVTAIRPLLPAPRGVLTGWLTERLHRRVHDDRSPDVCSVVDPHTDDMLFDDDAQLALHCIYELSYRGFDGVHDAMERDPAICDLRRDLEDLMETVLRREIGELSSWPMQTLEWLAMPGDGPSLSQFMVDHGTREHLRQFAIHRSAYQLKEADPHSWGLPRLSGRAKSAMVEIQFDEYGAGRPGRAHAELFATTMASLGLDSSYGCHLERLPGTTLATGNVISLFGTQRRLLPALLGHLALFEMTSTGPMQRYSDALARIGVGEGGREFFDVHVAADARHEVIALTDLVGGYLESEPCSGREISFGAQALTLVERNFTRSLVDAFRSGRSSLLPDPTDHASARPS